MLSTQEYFIKVVSYCKGTRNNCIKRKKNEKEKETYKRNIKNERERKQFLCHEHMLQEQELQKKLEA